MILNQLDLYVILNSYIDSSIPKILERFLDSVLFVQIPLIPSNSNRFIRAVQVIPMQDSSGD